MDHLQASITEEYHNLVEKTKVTSGESGFYSENAIQEIGGALEKIALVTVADKDIFMKLTEAVKALTCNNEPLTTQLSDAMKINIDMAKNLNLKTAQDPKDKRLAEKAKRKAVFEKNLDTGGYFRTH